MTGILYVVKTGIPRYRQPVNQNSKLKSTLNHPSILTPDPGYQLFPNRLVHTLGQIAPQAR